MSCPDAFRETIVIFANATRNGILLFHCTLAPEFMADGVQLEWTGAVGSGEASAVRSRPVVNDLPL
jgi:hypothetical protein